MRRRARTEVWGRRYPPLTGAVLAVLLAGFVLPSALNVPQSNPTQTLEFAPVPPTDEDPPPPDVSNVASLSLGSSSTAPDGDALGGDGRPLPPPPPPPGAGTRPVTKRCIGNPPRQTEDPTAPPCVAFFEGDNGGATYAGVSEDEIRILVYSDYGAACGTSKGCEYSEQQQYIDLAEPPPPGGDAFLMTRHMRVWQTYFNERYQTYGRFVHFHLYYGLPTEDITPETRRAEVADNLDVVDPFAVVIGRVSGGFVDEYVDGMARAQRPVFTSNLFSDASFFGDRAPFVWGNPPSLELHAKLFSEYVCRRVAPFPVSFGDNDNHGDDRIYGLIYANDPGYPQLVRFKDLVVDLVADCGVQFQAEGSFPLQGRMINASGSTYAPPVMAQFQQQGVTTVIWPGGSESNFSKAGAAIDYRPEWIVAGDSLMDGSLNGQFQDQTAWQHAWLMSLYARVDNGGVSQRCRSAFEGAGGQESDTTFDYGIACLYYPLLLQLFTGIQVAGPQVSPQSIDRGYHAIPAVESTDPRVRACFYEPGDYTCAKDATATWWDPDADNPGSQQAGCWRLPEEGRRFLATTWPDEPIESRRSDTDPCQGVLGGGDASP